MFELTQYLRGTRHTWLVTGSAGFIGSNLVEALLAAGQDVVGLDNYSTGSRANLEEVRSAVDEQAWRRFHAIDGDISALETCRAACRGVDYVLHHAALGSVPMSIEDPLATHDSNVTGFLNILVAARDAGVKRVVYASSSAVYGDCPNVPAVEDQIGNPLSPYGAGKQMNELYASAFGRCYGMAVTGLRYFNVFGKRQDPEGAYAAVIPKWIAALLVGETVYINGDGETTRDFCHVDNVVQANVIAALTEEPRHANQVFNIAMGGETTLNELHALLAELIGARKPAIGLRKPVHREFRAGDIRISRADIAKAKRALGYAPTTGTRSGLERALDWYIEAAGGPRK